MHYRLLGVFFATLALLVRLGDWFFGIGGSYLIIVEAGDSVRVVQCTFDRG
jgi:hypothetical protein